MSDTPTPAPRANPPITIGPFANVPAPGSPIRSDWPQQTAQWIVDHRTNATINTVDTPSIRIIAATVVITTGADGSFYIGYPVVFSDFPLMNITCGDANSPAPFHVATIASLNNVNGISCKAWNTSGVAMASVTIRVNYQVIGRS